MCVCVCVLVRMVDSLELWRRSQKTKLYNNKKKAVFKMTKQQIKYQSIFP